MGFYQDITYISLTGSKENVLRLLNAAICCVGTGNVIVEDDNLETINLKIKDEEGKCGLSISLQDLLDEKCDEDSILCEKNRYFSEKLNERKAFYSGELKLDFKSEEEAFAYFKDIDGFCNARMIEIVAVEQTENEYIVRFELYEWDCEFYKDWLDWSDIARVFNSRVTVNRVICKNGEIERSCDPVVYP